MVVKTMWVGKIIQMMVAECKKEKSEKKEDEVLKNINI